MHKERGWRYEINKSSVKSSYLLLVGKQNVIYSLALSLLY